MTRTADGNVGDLHRGASRSSPAEPEHFDLAFTAVTQPCPWPKAYGGDLVAAGRGRGDALGDRRQDAALDAQLLPAPGRHRRRRSATRWSCCATGAATAPGRCAATRTASRSTSAWPASPRARPAAAFGQPGETALAARRHPGPGRPAQLGGIPRRRAGTSRRKSSMTERSEAYWSGGRSFDMRHVPGPVYLTVEGGAGAAPGGVGQAVRRAAPRRRAQRRAAGPRRARLRLRLHDPRAGAARARPAVGRSPAWSPPASTTPCGSTGRATASTTGCSTPRRRWRPTPAAAWAPASFFTRDHRHLATVVQEGMLPLRLTGRIPPMPPAAAACHRRRTSTPSPATTCRRRDLWPMIEFTTPELRYPDRLNAAAELDRRARRDASARTGPRCAPRSGETWTYGELRTRANQVAQVLTEDLGLVPGSARAAPLAEQPVDGRRLARRAQGGRRRGDHDGRAARP